MSNYETNNDEIVLTGRFRTDALVEIAKNQALSYGRDLEQNPDFLIILILMNDQQGPQWQDTHVNFHRFLSEGEFEKAADEVLNSRFARRDPTIANDISSRLRNLNITQEREPAPSLTSKFEFSAATRKPIPVEIAELIEEYGIEGYTAEDFDELENHLIAREGYRGYIYECITDTETFGIGHAIKSNAERRLIEFTPKEGRYELAMEFFKNDRAKAFKAAAEQIQMLEQAGHPAANNPVLLNALVSVNFQLGTKWHEEHVKTWGLMMDGRFNDAIPEAADSRWYSQTRPRVEDFQAALAHTAELAHQLNATPGDQSQTLQARPD